MCRKLRLSRLVCEMLHFVYLLVATDFARDILEYDDDITPALSMRMSPAPMQPEHHFREADYQMYNPVIKNLNCEDFRNYALNCTIEAALMYNASRKTPPVPAKIQFWCNAIKHLTSCAMDWNADCKDVTDNHFNEESIKGHLHVVNNICESAEFLLLYEDLRRCIESTSKDWEKCYGDFKMLTDETKNASSDWTHYKTHFYWCCARARFRHCTLNAIFANPHAVCTRDEAITLQKFSIIVSEADVLQDCEVDVMYPNCPGGDPRPNEQVVMKLVNKNIEATRSKQRAELNAGFRKEYKEVFVFVFLTVIIKLLN